MMNIRAAGSGVGSNILRSLSFSPSYVHTSARNFTVMDQGTYKSRKSFHRIENSSPWSPLHKIRVGSPRPKSPRTPSCSITSLTASARCISTHLMGAGKAEHTV